MDKLFTVFDRLITFKNFTYCNIFIFILKVFYSVYFKFPGLHFEDWRIAKNLATYGIYSEFINIGPTAYKLPIYPIYLSFWIKIFPHFPKEAIIISQHFIYLIIPFLIIYIGRQLFNNKVGLIASFIFIFSPAYFYYSNVLEATNVFIIIFLVWISLYLNIYYKLKNSRIFYTVFGFVTAILALTQVVVVPIIVVGLLVLIGFNKISLKNFFLVGIVSALSYSPWIIRNKIVFDKVIISKTPVWQNIYLSFTPDPNHFDDLKLVSHEHEAYTFQARKKINEFEMEDIYEKEIKRVLKDNNFLYVKKMVQNVALLWYVPTRYINDTSLSTVVGRKIFVVILNISSILSLIYLFRSGRKKLVIGFLIVFGGFSLPYAIGHAANTRFKLDFEYLQYILFAAYFYKVLFRKYTNKKTPL